MSLYLDRTETPRLRLVERAPAVERRDDEPGWGLLVYAFCCLAFFAGVCLMVAFPAIPTAICNAALLVVP